MALCQLVSVEVHGVKIPWNVRQATQTDLAHAFRCVVPDEVSAHYSATLITTLQPTAPSLEATGTDPAVPLYVVRSSPSPYGPSRQTSFL